MNYIKVSVKSAIKILGEQVVEIVGDLNRDFSNPVSIYEAKSNLDICFSTHEKHEILDIINNTKAGVILCKKYEDFLTQLKIIDKTLILVKDPRLCFLRLVEAFFVPKIEYKIHPTAIIHPEAKIHSNVHIGPFTQIGKCEIGENTIIYGNTHIYSNSKIGSNVVIHSGVIIGSDGFGYQRNEDGLLEKFPHIGGVIVEDNVEIGANTCIDKGTLGHTRIGQGTKIDNLVHIAHNVKIGNHVIITAHVMIAGSTVIGDYTWIAPCACIREKISIGRNVTVGLAALVGKNLEDESVVVGLPAKKINKQ